MADSSVDLSAASGNVDTRTEGTNGNHRQVVVVGDPATNAGVAPVDGVLGLAVYFSTRPTVAIVGNIPAAGGSLTAYQGSAPWLVTLATLPVQTNVTGYAIESGGNLDSIVTTLNAIKTKTDNLDVSLGSRLASGGTLPITGTISALNAGGSLTAFQGGNPWLVTQATLPVVANINNSSLPVTQSGTWTVQPGNTPNTTAWLVTMATIPVVATVSVTPQMTVTAIQGDPGTKPWLATLATLPVMTNVTGYALESGNIASILAKLDVSLGSRLASGSTLPVTGTLGALNAGGSLSSAQLGTWTVQPGNTPNTTAWLTTQATLPVVVGGTVNSLNAGGSLSAFQSGTWTVQPGNTPNTIAWLVTFATIPVVTSVSVGSVNQGNAGSSAWLMTMATLPVVGDFTVSSVGQGNAGSQAWLVTQATLPVAVGTPPVSQSGTWTVQPGNTPNTTAWLVTMGTLPITGSLTVAGQATVTAIQGDPGSKAWLATLATLPVVTNVTGYALESGGNLDSIVTTLNSIKTKTDNLDVTLGSRLASGGTLPITGTVSALNAGGSLTAFQGGTWTAQPGNTPNTVGWLVTLATLPVNIGTPSVLAAGGSLSAAQLGTWTVQPGNTPNTTAWLITQATLPVTVGTHAVTQSGTWNVFSSLASGTNYIAGAQYMPTLASLSSMAYGNQKLDLFSNLMVNTNVPLPNSTRFNRFLTFASMASIMAAPGTGKRLVVREMDFSGNATLSVKLVEDHAGTPVTVWGPHYFLPYAGFIKPTCYVPITANKSLGIDITGSAFNSTLDIRIETENV